MADAITYVVGGFHTTGNFLTWLFFYLALYPDVQEQVAEELRRYLQEKNFTVDDEAISKLT